MTSKQDFYENLASFYHLIFENWDESIESQGEVLSKLLLNPEATGPVLDCACGIGTQAFALAKLGYKVEASDLSSSEIDRAKEEAKLRDLSVNFRVDDMRFLSTAPFSHYGAIIAMDNSIPHLDSDEEIVQALGNMNNSLKEDGILLLSLRDYKVILNDRPKSTPPQFFMDGQYRRIIHQVWDWIDERRYIVHLYITYEDAKGWKSHHFVGQYRAIKVKELVSLVLKAGFVDVNILKPSETGYYQPIIRAHSRK